MNCQAFNPFEGVSTDNWIVFTAIRLSFTRSNKKKQSTFPPYKWSLLTVKDKYAIVVMIKTEILQTSAEEPSPNITYNYFITLPEETSADVIRSKPKHQQNIALESNSIECQRATVKENADIRNSNPSLKSIQEFNETLNKLNKILMKTNKLNISRKISTHKFYCSRQTICACSENCQRVQ